MSKVKTGQIEMIDIDRVLPWERNRNKHSKEQIERLARIIEYQGWRHPIVVSRLNGKVAAGHGRLAAAKHLGLDKVPVMYQDFDSEEQQYAFMVSDNAIASWAELDLSGINMDVPEMGPDFDLDLLGIKDFVLDMSEKELSEKEIKELYTKKIEIPIYEPKGERPSFDEMLQTEKTKELLEEIESAEGIDEETKVFLRKAAERHTVFNYEKIAEFYCHQPRRVKDLMEKSALVLIDFDKAIENGFVQMTKDIAEAYDADEK